MTIITRRKAPPDLLKGAQFGSRPGRAPGTVLFWSLVCYLGVLSAIGGAEVTFGLRSIIIGVASAVFVVMFILTGGPQGFGRFPLPTKIGFALIALIPLLQVVPLPPAIWHVLPGQHARLAALSIAGLQGSWQPASLTPVMTTYSGLVIGALICATTAVAHVSEQHFRMLCLSALGVVGFGVIAGFVQVSSAGEYPRFNADADFASLIGLFANKNHMGLVMACSIAIADYAKSVSRKSPTVNRLFFAYWALIGLALPLTNSRAGLVIGAIVSAIVAVPYLRNLSRRNRRAVAAAVGLVALLISFLPLPGNYVARFNEVADDLRWTMLSHSLTLVRSYWLFGSGVGSFADVFLTFEKREWLFPTYVNNVHNDYLQLLLEFGVGGVIAVFLVAAGICSRLLSTPADGLTRLGAAPKMGLLICGAFALHSIVDYPLRRPAAAVILAIGIAAICRDASSRSAPEVKAGRGRGSRA